ncbi:MAG: hypothetical protein J6Y61_02475, partial [Bacteroidales bacterium]|nr:hypothetical protein [Bacteroidales bacterium]
MNRFFILMATVMVAISCSSNAPEDIFVKSGENEWGVALSTPSGRLVSQVAPVQVQIWHDSLATDFFAPYSSLAKSKDAMVAAAQIEVSGVVFDVEDTWSRASGDLTLSRSVKVKGDMPEAGYATSFNLVTDLSVRWQDVSFLA